MNETNAVKKKCKKEDAKIDHGWIYKKMLFQSFYFNNDCQYSPLLINNIIRNAQIYRYNTDRHQ